MDRVFNFLVAVDCFANGLLGGNPNETISARAGKAAACGCSKAAMVVVVIDALFFWQDDHCAKSAQKYHCEARQQPNRI